MRSVLSWFAAAAIGLAGIGFNFADDMPDPANAPGTGNRNMRNLSDAPPATQPTMVSDKELRSVRHGLAGVTDKLLTKDGFGDLNKWVIWEDMAVSATPAIPKASDMTANSDKKFQNSADLNAAVDQLRNDWNDAYKTSFSLNDSDRQTAVFNDSFQIYSGDIGNLARAAAERILPGNQQPADNTTAENAATGEARDVTVYINTGMGKESANAILHLRKESSLLGSSWKVVLPTSAQPQAIHDALLTQLHWLHDNKADWPADENTAYRVVSQRILATLNATAPTPMPAPMPN